MPLLDVSDILLDPDFCEQLTVLRNPQSVANTGNAVVVPVTLNPYGVVNPNSREETLRTDDYQSARQSITVLAYNFQFFNPSNGYSSDSVIWNGDTYAVVKVDNWMKYGIGYSKAECDLIQSVM